MKKVHRYKITIEVETDKAVRLIDPALIQYENLLDYLLNKPDVYSYTHAIIKIKKLGTRRIKEAA